MRKRVWSIGVAAMLGTLALPVLAQQQVSRECRQEVRKLCTETGRGRMVRCLREKADELSAACRTEVSSALRDRRGSQRRNTERAEQNARAPRTTPDLVISYGSDQRQGVDYYAPDAAVAKPPLVLFVHGGGWRFGSREGTVQFKPGHLTANGFAFGSLGYRLLPDAPVETQAQDVADGLAAMRARADELGYDPDHVVLMGHSAGAHLAALVATDPQYAGAHFGAIKGVVLLDGAGYDVARQMAGATELPELYEAAFGTDPVRQAALSPITHADARVAPNWLILHVADRPASRMQSEALGEKLAAGGAKVEVVAVDNTDHGRLNRELGSPGDVATARLDVFLQGLVNLP